jgi:NAD(P)-dependent dehydrogenase (short-subunit alcohol dehydrogenase family)
MISSRKLAGRTAVVTGGSRGVGRGIAKRLVANGARVYVSGRTEADLASIEGAIPIRCDHRDDAQVDRLFRRVQDEAGGADVLVNSVWGGYEGMMENGEFTWMKPFWLQPRWRWDAMFAAGVRASFVACQLAAPAMIARKQGLIVNVSFWAAQKHIGNLPYGVSKAATDKLTADVAHELRPHGVAAVSLYPGMVRTEKVMEAAAWLDLSNSESPEFIGEVVVGLATDPSVAGYSGKAVVAAELAQIYGIRDLDGKQPRPLTLKDV